MPSETEYVKRFIEKTQQLPGRMRWKAHFFFSITPVSRVYYIPSGELYNYIVESTS